MKNILICLEKMGIGGVETSVINQALEYKRKKIDCVIASKKGVFSEILDNNAIQHENINFPLEKNINIESTKKIIEIIEKYNIEQVIINQLPCILSVLPACIIKNIPYVAYVHNPKGSVQDNEDNAFDWYEKNYPIFKELLPFYYANAQKIISISEYVQEYVKNRYNINSSKMKVIHNSIDLNKYKSSKDVTTKDNFILISRMSPDKLQSVKNGIDIFDVYDSEDKKLMIVGDGNKLEEIKNYASEKKSKDKIEFLGQQKDVINLIDKNDIVLGLDRVLLEAIAMKRIAVNIGYDKPKEIIDLSNIEIEADEGFCGENLKSCEPIELASKIKNTNIDLLQNYNFVKEKLNITNNIYLDEPIKPNYECAIFEVFKMFARKEEYIQNEVTNKEEYKHKIVQLEKSLKAKTEEVNNLQNEYNKTFDELKAVYESKRFKVANKIAKIFKK